MYVTFPNFITPTIDFCLFVSELLNVKSASPSESSKNKNIGEVRKLLDAGEVFFANKKFDSALQYYNWSIILNEIEKDSASAAYT